MNDSICKSQSILFITPWEYSHFSGHLKLASKLHERGKKIIFSGFSDYRKRINENYDFVEIAQLERPLNSLVKKYEHQSKLN